MIGFLKTLLGAISGLFRWLGDKQLIEAGKAEQANAEIQELEKRKESAERARTVDDPVRSERLRKKYDRASRTK